jgi:chromosome segregation ATPase
MNGHIIQVEGNLALAKLEVSQLNNKLQQTKKDVEALERKLGRMEAINNCNSQRINSISEEMKGINSRLARLESANTKK